MYYEDFDFIFNDSTITVLQELRNNTDGLRRTQISDIVTVLQALHYSANGLTRTQISNLFKRNRSSDEIAATLTLLLKHDKVKREVVTGKTRPFEVWKAK